MIHFFYPPLFSLSLLSWGAPRGCWSRVATSRDLFPLSVPRGCVQRPKGHPGLCLLSMYSLCLCAPSQLSDTFPNNAHWHSHGWLRAASFACVTLFLRHWHPLMAVGTCWWGREEFPVCRGLSVGNPQSVEGLQQALHLRHLRLLFVSGP